MFHGPGSGQKQGSFRGRLWVGVVSPTWEGQSFSLWLHKITICSVWVSAHAFGKCINKTDQGLFSFLKIFFQVTDTIFFRETLVIEHCPVSDFQTVVLLQIICNPTTIITAIPVLVLGKIKVCCCQKNVGAQCASGHINPCIEDQSHSFCNHAVTRAVQHSLLQAITGTTTNKWQVIYHQNWTVHVHTHTLSLLCWENVNQFKKKRKHTDPSQSQSPHYCKIGWKPLETLVATTIYNISQREKTHRQNTISWRRDRLSCCWVLQMHERNALMSFSISTIERQDNANSSFDIITTKSKEIIISSSPVDDSLQLEIAQRHICTSINGLKHKASWGSSKSLLQMSLFPLGCIIIS